MGERRQRWRNTKIITFLPNRPFPHSTPVIKHKKMRLRRGWTISYKSLYFVHPCLDLMPLFTGMRERSTHNCITAVKWDAYAVENTAGNARRCNPGRQILLTLLTWQHQQKNFYQFFYCDLWKASFIVHYQSECIPKSNSKQETLQTIYSCILVFIQWVYYHYFFLFIATKKTCFSYFAYIILLKYF